jgi:hypothetical protein
MPDPRMSLEQLLLGRARPNPGLPVEFTPESEGLPDSLLLRGSNVLLGLGGLGADTPDRRLGELLGAAAVPGVSAFKRFRPVLQELNAAIADYQVDPLRTALFSRVTQHTVFPSEAIRIPQGFELPEGFGPNLVKRPTEMYAERSRQLSIPRRTPKQTRVFNPSGVSSSKRLRIHEAPAIRSSEDLAVTGKAQGPAMTRKPLIQDRTSRLLRGRAARPGELNQAVVAQIKGQLAAGKSAAEIADKFGVAKERVQQILRGDSWNTVKAVSHGKTQ